MNLYCVIHDTWSGRYFPETQATDSSSQYLLPSERIVSSGLSSFQQATRVAENFQRMALRDGDSESEDSPS